MPTNARQLEILQHALGVDRYGRGQQYRNHYCAGGEDVAVCRELVEMGYMVQRATTETFPYFNCAVTDEGRRAMVDNSPAPPKLTRSQKRYQKFLDADSGMPFGEWIRHRA